jgi:hypothetical protein
MKTKMIKRLLDLFEGRWTQMSVLRIFAVERMSGVRYEKYETSKVTMALQTFMNDGGSRKVQMKRGKNVY